MVGASEANRGCGFECDAGGWSSAQPPLECPRAKHGDVRPVDSLLVVWVSVGGRAYGVQSLTQLF
jgi:hypothetical protein